MIHLHQLTVQPYTMTASPCLGITMQQLSSLSKQLGDRKTTIRFRSGQRYAVQVVVVDTDIDLDVEAGRCVQ